MRVIVTGTREEFNPNMLFIQLSFAEQWAMYDAEEFVVVHGGCPTGADKYASEWVKLYSRAAKEEVHLANWNQYGKKAGPLRNQKMVDLGADLVMAYPKGESRGTRGCIKMADKAGLKVMVQEVD